MSILINRRRTPIELEEVDAPRGESGSVLLIVAVRARVARARLETVVRVDAKVEPTGVQCVGEGSDAVRKALWVRL